MNKLRMWFCASVLIVTFLVVVNGCNKTQAADPANANLAPADQNAVPQPAPADEYGQSQASYTQPANGCAGGYEGCGQQLAEAPQPPPPLPTYSQPPCPGEGYIWTPGYWSYSEAGYYWVPGVWVLAPYVGALWTPPYWDYYGGHYLWHAGYWGRHIGFYGGINYGFGYTGLGFYGGYWNQGAFVYNREVTNINLTVVRNVYSHPVVNYTPFNRVSFNGGRGGIGRQPVAAELAVRRENRIAPLPAQIQHVREAAVNRTQFATANRGRPATAALGRPLATPYRAPAPTPRSWQTGEARPGAPVTNARPQAAPFARTEPMRQAPVQSAPAMRPQMAPQRSEQRAMQPSRQAIPQTRGEASRQLEARPAPARPQAAPAMSRPVPQPHFEARPSPSRAQAGPPMSRPAPQPHVEARPAPARPQSAPAMSRPAPQPRVEARPAPARPQPAPAMSRPAPQPRVEAHPAPAPRAEPHQEAKPAPQPGKQEHGHQGH